MLSSPKRKQQTASTALCTQCWKTCPDTVVQPYSPQLFRQVKLPGPALLLARQSGALSIQNSIQMLCPILVFILSDSLSRCPRPSNARRSLAGCGARGGSKGEERKLLARLGLCGKCPVEHVQNAPNRKSDGRFVVLLQTSRKQQSGLKFQKVSACSVIVVITVQGLQRTHV